MNNLPLAAWGWRDCVATPLSGGLINTTYAITRNATNIAVLQRMHPAFAPAVNHDIAAVTSHLAAKGLLTPTIIPTSDAGLWHTATDGTWRALTWVEGLPMATIPSAEVAANAGRLVGRFHAAMADFAYVYRFVRPGVHDTSAHLAKLVAQLHVPQAFAEANAATELGHQIVEALSLTPALRKLPLRHCHGDLKLNNLLFSNDGTGVALVDLDTVQESTLAYELGDAMRSWCNPVGENTAQPTFRPDYFHAALRGFAETAGATVTETEIQSVAHGLETICFELAARFCTDVFLDNYFGWDAARYPSRRAHNLVRARGQFALGQLVRTHRNELQELG